MDACTGSGKTLAFTIPCVEMIRRLSDPLKKHQVGAIIISPTRELSHQIFEVAQPLVQSLNRVGSVLLVGGSRSLAEDMATIKQGGAHIVIGTPGRVKDVFGRLEGYLDFRRLEVLILDEADRLLDMGFRKHLDAIMERLPKQRRTGLFSATQTEAVESLARAGLRNPVRVAVSTRTTPLTDAGSTRTWAGGKGEASRTPERLEIQYVECTEDAKLAALIGFLCKYSAQKMIVYVLSCASVDYLACALESLDVATVVRPGGDGGVAKKQQKKTKQMTANNNASTDNDATSPVTSASRTRFVAATATETPLVWALHGKMKQVQREKALRLFTESSRGCLLCTDVAARGLDVPDVDWVLQVDPPQDPNAFVHRVGRTARMGKSGRALIMLLAKEAAQYPSFLALRRIPLTEMPLEQMANWEALRQRFSRIDGYTPSSTSNVSGAVAGVMAAVRRASESDRDLMEKGVQAMVSYMRGYKEHDCKLIFRVEDLHIGRLGHFFGCLRLPRMLELKGRAFNKKGPMEVEGFRPSTVNPDDVAFRDKAREAARQAAVTDVKARRQREREERKQKATIAAQKAKLDKLGALNSGKRKKLAHKQDLRDLEDDYAMLKGAKKGKVSGEAYERSLGLVENDEIVSEEGKQKSKSLLQNAMKKKMKRMIRHGAGG